MDHCLALWRWNPQVVEIVDNKWLCDTLMTTELRLPEALAMEVQQEVFTESSEMLKQMEALISGAEDIPEWLEPMPLDIP